MKRFLFCVWATALLFLGVAPASATILTSGTGDGTLEVGVDGYGSFGSSISGIDTSDAFYDPVGIDESAGTTYESAIAVGFGGDRTYLTTGSIAGPDNIGTNLVIGTTTSSSMQSTFMVNALQFELNQSVSLSQDSSGVALGTILNQVYTITNTAAEQISFDVVRYLDGDLDFDGTIQDGGGRIVQSGNEILFETDGVGSGSATSQNFVGITGIGGITPETNRFEISSYSGLRGIIAQGEALDDQIDGDTNGDGFIDSAYDVTLALRNVFNLAPNEVVTYTTQTLFGNATPPAPGSIEALPLLPGSTDPETGAFNFDLPAADITVGETIFFDPIISTGYTYTVTGAEFDSVTAPTFAAVADADGYRLLFSSGGTDYDYALASGEMFNFGDNGFFGLTSFSLTGIDPNLALDPNDINAFVTGIAFENITASTVGMSQTPITFDTDINAVPAPATLSLLLLGLVLIVKRRLLV
ncbi:hypothetical protein [Flavobacterium sp. W21_SRS_FM6]|uniref:hypothetical protein n=1 Tax=Flavobacterium sp. W21_SRS_FM6 TaxID=3240268 RepID=UPI003F8E5B90